MSKTTYAFLLCYWLLAPAAFAQNPLKEAMAANKLLTNYAHQVAGSQDPAGQVTLKPGLTVNSFAMAGNGLAAFNTARLAPSPAAIDASSPIVREKAGAVDPAITFIDPQQAPVGSTLFLKVSGSNTHFGNNSMISFSDPGIILMFVLAVSATELELKVSVGANVPLGFKDIVVTTTLPDGSIEEAKGIGLLEIIATPATPTILSIFPNSLKAGEEYWVYINAINTSFGDTSIVDLGSGITVLAVEHVNREELLARIQVASDAVPGYRDVVVTSGTEVATENVVGPFQVLPADCGIAGVDAGPDQTVYYGYPPAGCATLAVTGGEGDLQYLWSTGDTGPSTEVCPVETTMYTVLVSQGACSKRDTVVVYVVDVRCGNNLDKVAVCHKTGKGSKTLCLGIDGVKDHLKHGDKLGGCVLPGAAETSVVTSLRVRVGPNPSTGQFNLYIGSNSNNEKITVMVTDLLGRKVEVRNNVAPNSNLLIGRDYLPGAYIVELRQGNQRTTVKLFKAAQ